MVLQNIILVKILGSKNLLPAHGRVGARATPILFSAAHFAKQKILNRFLLLQNTNFGGGGKRGRAKIPSPQSPSFLPARAFSLAREARHQFRSKKVRISSNKRTKIKLSGIFPTISFALCAKMYGNTGSPRTPRLAKRRFEIPCDFKYLLCPINQYEYGTT